MRRRVVRESARKSTEQPVRRVLKKSSMMRESSSVGRPSMNRSRRFFREADGDTCTLKFKVPVWMCDALIGKEYTARVKSSSGRYKTYSVYPDENYMDENWYRNIEEDAYEIASEDWEKSMNDDSIGVCFRNDNVVRTYMKPCNNSNVYVYLVYAGNPTESEIRKLTDALDGQMSDGWGESFEQTPVYVNDNVTYEIECYMPDDWADEFIEEHSDEFEYESEARDAAQEEWESIGPIELRAECRIYVKFWDHLGPGVKFVGIK